MILLRFGQTIVGLTHDGSATSIPLCDVIDAAPQDNDAYRQTARRLGYGDDTEAMARHHDAMHVALCAWLGLEASPTLSTVGGRPVGDAALHGLEEDAVCAVTAFAQAVGVDVERFLMRMGGVG